MIIPIFLSWIEQVGWNLTNNEGLLELDAGLLLLFSSLITLGETVEDCKLNLLFFRKSLSSPLNRVDDNLGCRVETLGKHEANLVASFDSTSRVVEDRLDEERSGLD